MKRVVLYLALSLMSMQALLAQEGSLLKDINATSPSAGSDPAGFTLINDVSYFSANDGVRGRELWKTDGTATGTVLVSDIKSGSASSNPQQITNVNGTAFFIAAGDTQGFSLWKTGGTAATTTKVKDFAQAFSVQGMIDANGTLFFGVESAEGSMQVWKSNGSAAGTQLIKTFTQTQVFSPRVFKGQVYFGATDATGNINLWKSNGTPEGTMLIPNMPVNAGYSVYETLTAAGNFLYYVATVYTDSYRLYLVKSDGTSQGTVVVKELENVSDATRLYQANGVLFFKARGFDGHLDAFFEDSWRTDGTAQGTFMIARLRNINGEFDTLNRNGMIVINGVFYFVNDAEKEIWKSGGTVQGTQRITNFGPRGYEGSIQRLISIGSTLYYATTDGISSREVWKTDVTTETTSVAYDLTPNGSTEINSLAYVNNLLLISANNGMYGTELFRYQPILAGNITRINAGGPDFTTATKKLFIADKYYSGIDRTSSVASGDILNTTNDVLYRSGRSSPSFSYNIPVVNGDVNVTLHFSETYFGVPGTKGEKGGVGSRQFHVNLEGGRKLTNYDIFAAAGGAMRANQLTIPVTVTDGVLNIDFLTGAADLPKVCAIEVTPAQVGTLTYTPEADATVRNGIYKDQNFGSDPLMGVKGGTGNTNRKTYLRFRTPDVTTVKSAKLRIYANNHESVNGAPIGAGGVYNDTWTENGITFSNAPAHQNPPAESRTSVRGELKYYEMDVTDFVKSQVAGDKVVSMAIVTAYANNLINIHSKENASGFAPQLIIETSNTVNPAARIGAESEYTSENSIAAASVIYPNPARDYITLEISRSHQSEVDLKLISQTGREFQLGKSRIDQTTSKLEVSLPDNVPAGIYLLKVKSNTFSEVLKMLIAD